MNLGDMTVGADPEELFICPYDKSHVIRKKIIPYHLMKCRKNWTGKGMAVTMSILKARYLVQLKQV